MDREALESLDAFLSAGGENGEVMHLDELDGFLTGLLLSPKRIPVEEWWGHIWSANGDPDVMPRFASEVEGERIFHAIIMLGNSVELALRSPPGTFEPILSSDPDDGSAVWQDWICGFRNAFQLAPEAWLTVLETGDEDTIDALNLLIALMDSVSEENIVEVGDRPALLAAAPGFIGGCVEALYRWRVGRENPTPAYGWAIQ